MALTKKLTRSEWDALSEEGRLAQIGELTTATAVLQQEASDRYTAARDEFAMVGRVKGFENDAFLNTVLDDVQAQQALEDSPINTSSLMSSIQKIAIAVGAVSILVGGVRVFDTRALRFNPLWDRRRLTSNYTTMVKEYRRLRESGKLSLPEVELWDTETYYKDLEKFPVEAQKAYENLYSALQNITENHNFQKF